MSCSMTTAAVYLRVKTVTRRDVDTWTTLKTGDRLTLVEKAMGLPKGSKQVVMAEVEVTRVSVEPLVQITSEDCYREGFPDLTPLEFCRMWVGTHQPIVTLTPVMCRRIEWRYLP